MKSLNHFFLDVEHTLSKSHKLYWAWFPDTVGHHNLLTCS